MSVKLFFSTESTAVLLHNPYPKKKAKQAANYRIESRHFVVELCSDEELCPENAALFALLEQVS